MGDVIKAINGKPVHLLFFLEGEESVLKKTKPGQNRHNITCFATARTNRLKAKLLRRPLEIVAPEATIRSPCC